MTKIYHFDNNYNKNLCQKYNITLTWEKEVLTEYKSYQYIKNSDSKLPLSYIAYPWALLIDYYHNKFNKIFDSFFDFLSELGLLKQLELKNDYSITVVQSYHFDKYCKHTLGNIELSRCRSIPVVEVARKVAPDLHC